MIQFPPARTPLRVEAFLAFIKWAGRRRFRRVVRSLCRMIEGKPALGGKSFPRLPCRKGRLARADTVLCDLASPLQCYDGTAQRIDFLTMMAYEKHRNAEFRPDTAEELEDLSAQL